MREIQEKDVAVPPTGDPFHLFCRPADVFSHLPQDAVAVQPAIALVDHMEMTDIQGGGVHLAVGVFRIRQTGAVKEEFLAVQSRERIALGGLKHVLIPKQLQSQPDPCFQHPARAGVGKHEIHRAGREEDALLRSVGPQHDDGKRRTRRAAPDDPIGGFRREARQGRREEKQVIGTLPLIQRSGQAGRVVNEEKRILFQLAADQRPDAGVVHSCQNAAVQAVPGL